MFSITFVKPTNSNSNPDRSMGRIVTRDLDETFEAYIDEWREADYRASWQEELRRILKGSPKAVLLTVACSPASANWLRGYTLYRFNDVVRIHEQLFLTDDLRREFDLANPGEAVEDYRSTNEDGVRISEWSTSLREIRDFYSSEYATLP